MTTPQLRALPSTAEAMDLLGNTTIAGVLGTYQHNLDERDRLFHRLLQEGISDSEASKERYRELFKAWRASEHRLWLFLLLANEMGSLPEAVP